MKKINVEIRKSYLVKFVDPDKSYTTSYEINNNGNKIDGIFDIYGRDLTENQILELFLTEQL